MSSQTETLGTLSQAVSSALGLLSDNAFVQRLWQKDPSLWKQEPEHQRIIRNSLGWLTVVGPMQQQVADLLQFGNRVRQEGFTHAMLLGMGGSSLCVEVLRNSFARVSGYPEMVVLDSTDPATIQSFERSIDPDKTLFIVASKSGTTVEVSSFYKYFFQKARSRRGVQAGKQFIAITDPGTALEKIGNEQGFLRVFSNPVDIGGRFSALSFFGLVPAALIGLDVERFLERAQKRVTACGPAVPVEDNPGVRLGVILAEAAKSGRDKMTLLTPQSIATFGLWVEQLVAESTGKEGMGIVPVDGEPLGKPSLYGQDRLFVAINLASEPDSQQEAVAAAFEAAGHPVVRLSLDDRYDIGAECFRWEIATAVAGSLMGINAFDQPNVQESKDNTNRFLAEFRSVGSLPQDLPVWVESGLSLFCSTEVRTRIEVRMGDTASVPGKFSSYLSAFFRQARGGDYVALNAYLEPSAEHAKRLQSLRTQLRDRLGTATTVGYGPRFLHSTGQLHKGGADNGLFIQITADDLIDLPIPEEPYGFSVLKQAQALGDFQSLVSRQRRAIRVHLGKDISRGLDQLIHWMGNLG